jgi:hypothetical protein
MRIHVTAWNEDGETILNREIDIGEADYLPAATNWRFCFVDDIGQSEPLSGGEQ